MKTYFVFKDDDLVARFEKFDQKAITDVFKKAVASSLPGEEVHYGWSDKKYCYAPYLTVENVNGTYKRQCFRGERLYYVDYSI